LSLPQAKGNIMQESPKVHWQFAFGNDKAAAPPGRNAQPLPKKAVPSVAKSRCPCHCRRQTATSCRKVPTCIGSLPSATTRLLRRRVEMPNRCQKKLCPPLQSPDALVIAAGKGQHHAGKCSWEVVAGALSSKPYFTINFCVKTVLFVSRETK
jgi:hypothetical protein